jgi:hypothetical protein
MRTRPALGELRLSTGIGPEGAGSCSTTGCTPTPAGRSRPIFARSAWLRRYHESLRFVGAVRAMLATYPSEPGS